MKEVVEIRKECFRTSIEEKLIRYFLNNNDPERFKFWINLIDELLVIIDLSQDMDSKCIWGSWKSELEFLREKYISCGMRKVEATGIDGNPLRGNYKKYPILSCLTADSRVSIGDSYRGICLLLVQKIFVEDAAIGLNSFCDLLRRSKDISKKLYKLIAGLPAYTGDLISYKESLNKSVDKLLENESDDGSEKSRFLRAFFILTAVISKHKWERGSRSSHGSDVFRDEFSEDITIGIRQRVNACVGRQSDAPDNVAFVSDRGVDKEDKKHRPLERLLAETEKSRYWLRDFQHLSKFSSPCLTAIEQSRLTGFMKKGLASNDDELVVVSLAVAIGYLSPFSVDEAINSFDSAEQSKMLMDGVFTCDIAPVKGRFKVEEKNKATCLNVVSSISLNLHDELVSVLSTYKSKDGKTIFEKFNVNSESVKDRVDKELAILRNKDQYNITKRRIDFALSAALTMSERNPVASFHINGNLNNTMPVLAHYGVMSENMLCEIYAKSVNNLMSAA